MGENNFNALTSEVLNKNKEIYTKALDYAFANNDIKNIAITGIYGAGKSTVWNTYVNKSEFNNVITVSLGKYENYTKEDYNIQKEASETKTTDSDAAGAEGLCGDESKKAGGIDDENRVEEQIINQILSQIDPKKIPLSKYCFKSNKSDMSIRLHSLGLLSMIFSILLWKASDIFISVFGESYKNCVSIVLMLLCAILFFVPMYCCLYNFYRGNKFRISKISFNGTEADMDNDMGDETVLDRDMKELVYLLGSSDTEVVVFEDLDRYNDISIYTKLRELNFILNNYVKINGKDKPVRFIYLLKDGIFFSKNRTKFFDFIIPIVPIVNSFISEYHLDKFLRDNGIVEEVTILADVALYVDDMRLIKNIVNEYIIYSRILQLESKNSSMDASLEYSYLNNDILFALITLKNILPNEFEHLQENIGYINDIFKKLEAKNYNNTSYKTIISGLSIKERDELFSKKGLDSLERRYFDFIRFLIVNGFLDNSYGKFIVDLHKADTSNLLKRNDIIYIKGLKEGRSLDVLLDVETPDLIIKRLNKDDFMCDNILNINIFKTCLEKEKIDNVIAITESIIKHNKYDDLSKILDKMGLDLEGKYFNILLHNKENLLYNILDYFQSKTLTGIDGGGLIVGEEAILDDEYAKIFNDILISILITEHTDENQLKSLKEYLEYGKITKIIDQICSIYEGERYYFEMGIGQNIEEIKYRMLREDMNKIKKELNNFIENVNLIGIIFDNISKIIRVKESF